MRAAVYCRISEDRVGAHLGVSRQEEDCRKLCADRGYEVAAVHVDNDLSASKYAKKPRPAYEALKAEVQAGEVDVIVAWHNDRLLRRPRDLEDLIDLLEQSGATVATVTAGDYDLTTTDGRLRARIYATIAAHETEHNSERARRKTRDIAAAGRPSMGGSRPFGYEADKVTVRPEEAAVTREMVDRFLAGAGWCTLVRWLTAEGVPTVSGKPWSEQTVKTMLTNGRIAGRRQFRPAEGEGFEVDAVWPAIITTQQLEAVRYLAADRKRKAMALARWNSRYLVSGLVYCGRCEARMSTATSDGKRRYQCVRILKGCMRCACQAHLVEDEVVKRLFVRVEQLPPAGEDPGRWEAELARVDRELAELDHRYHVEGVLSRVAYFAATDRLRAAAREVEVAQARAQTSAVPVGPLRDRWDGMTWEAQRDTLRRLIERVWIHPVGKTNPFTPSRIGVDWLV